MTQARLCSLHVNMSRPAGHTYLQVSIFAFWHAIAIDLIRSYIGAMVNLSTVMAKRPGSQLENLQDSKRVPPPESFPAILARAGQEKYGDMLNFEIGYTPGKGYHVIVGCKVCHWHPPAGSVSHARIVVYEDGSFYFQVLLQSKEAGTMETVDHFLSVCEMMANVIGEYKICPGIDLCEYETKYFSKIRYDVKKLKLC